MGRSIYHIHTLSYPTPTSTGNYTTIIYFLRNSSWRITILRELLFSSLYNRPVSSLNSKEIWTLQNLITESKRNDLTALKLTLTTSPKRKYFFQSSQQIRSLKWVFARKNARKIAARAVGSVSQPLLLASGLAQPFTTSLTKDKKIQVLKVRPATGPVNDNKPCKYWFKTYFGLNDSVWHDFRIVRWESRKFCFVTFDK